MCSTPMALNYSLSHLPCLQKYCNKSPDALLSPQHLGILRRCPKYIHRGSRRKSTRCPHTNNIDSLWSWTQNLKRNIECSADTNNLCLYPLTKVTQNNPTAKNAFLALLNVRSLNHKATFINDVITVMTRTHFVYLIMC